MFLPSSSSSSWASWLGLDEDDDGDDEDGLSLSADGLNDFLARVDLVGVGPVHVVFFFLLYGQTDTGWLEGACGIFWPVPMLVTVLVSVLVVAVVMAVSGVDGALIVVLVLVQIDRVCRADKVGGSVSGGRVAWLQDGASGAAGQVAVQRLGALGMEVDGARAARVVVVAYVAHRVVGPVERSVLGQVFSRVFYELFLGAAVVAERGAAREQPALLSGHSLGADAAKKSVVFYAFFPEVFAAISVVEVEFDGVFVEAVVFRMKFDQEFFALEAQLADFGPRKCVYFGAVLENQNAHVGHC
ncbi:hypothetical protein BpHYR1_016524 [Brachionus plicatilis]|uniref:Uncharacterized protein n=1 Tax=Brachionus plicatilis TaxID=10195 RepID=A0A3M7R7P4_BRAPC|nr:hypothetical protein BpHYR1_016524 [Brachionus plicatilis]